MLPKPEAAEILDSMIPSPSSSCAPSEHPETQHGANEEELKEYQHLQTWNHQASSFEIYVVFNWPKLYVMNKKHTFKLLNQVIQIHPLFGFFCINVAKITYCRMVIICAKRVTMVTLVD